MGCRGYGVGGHVVGGVDAVVAGYGIVVGGIGSGNGFVIGVVDVVTRGVDVRGVVAMNGGVGGAGVGCVICGDWCDVSGYVGGVVRGYAGAAVDDGMAGVIDVVMVVALLVRLRVLLGMVVVWCWWWCSRMWCG